MGFFAVHRVELNAAKESKPWELLCHGDAMLRCDLVSRVGVGWQLELIILEDSFSLNDSMILCT